MTDNTYIKHHFDHWLLFTAILLVGIGVTMNYSASAVLAQERYADSYFFLKRTLIFIGLGGGVLIGALNFNYHHYKKMVYPLLLLSLCLGVMTMIPGLGRKVSGATRWISLYGFRFQPSELIKLAMIIFLAYSLEKKTKHIRTLVIGILPNLIVMSVVALCILAQRDLGSAFTIACITWLMMYVAGARLAYLLSFAVATMPIIFWLIAGSDYRKRRMLSFLNPWSDQYGAGFQMIQSYVAFNEGGFFGRGLGEGQQKLFYLPEAHTDFIFSVIGEELGLIGVLAVIALFSFFAYRGIKIALNAPDLFGKYLALGATSLISLSAILNMAVVMGLLPTKGLTLPFISYGGSSLIVSFLAVGILLNISSFREVDA
ncbi:MAG: putative lipid II flippase FtsW [Pseudomonadota bacterium]